MGVPLACKGCEGICKKGKFFDENEFLNDEYQASRCNIDSGMSNIRTTGIVSLFKTGTLNSGHVNTTKLKGENKVTFKLNEGKVKNFLCNESKIEEEKIKIIPESVYNSEKKYKKVLDINEDWKKFYSSEEYNKLTQAIPKFKNNIDNEGNELIYSKGILGTYGKIPSFYQGYANTHLIYNGKGELFLQNGEKYEGNFYKGKLNGWGRFIDKNGYCFEGLFVDGGLTGKGYEIFQDESGNNAYYEGDFVNCVKEGKGKESTDIYDFDGDFSNDVKHGKGICTYKKCSDRYEGQFFKGVINGFGFYHWDNRHEYEGEFLNAQMHGKGKYRWPDGSQYVGEYIYNVKEGEGEFLWPDGRRFKGTFKDGKPNGKGELWVKGIKIDNAEFKNGKFVGNLKEILNKKRAEEEKNESPTKESLNDN